MYNLPYFKEKDPAVVMQFVREHPFAVLCGSDADGKPVATQVPLLILERGGKLFLQGHVQRKTGHHLAFEKNPAVLALFTGPHSYVSARWYSNPQTASTWNYMAVHASGRLRFLDDSGLLRILSETTAFFENNPNSTALLEKMPEEYVSSMMRAIIAFEIEVTSLEHVFKLSQNRDEKSYHNIIRHLQEGDAASNEVANEMKKRAAGVFGNDEHPPGTRP
jgi:transcriptional regulator